MSEYEYRIDPKIFDLDDRRIELLISNKIDGAKFVKTIKPEDPFKISKDSQKKIVYINLLTIEQIEAMKDRYVEVQRKSLCKSGGIKDLKTLINNKDLILRVYPELENSYRIAEEELSKASCVGCEEKNQLIALSNSLFDLASSVTVRDVTTLTGIFSDLTIGKLQHNEFNCDEIEIHIPSTLNKKTIPVKEEVKEVKSTPVNPDAKKIIFINGQSPGDGVTLAYAINALHKSHPGKFITDVRVPYKDIFHGNPNIVDIADNDPDVEKIKPEYSTIHSSNQSSVHFIHGFMNWISKRLNINIEPIEWSGCIHITDVEKGWFSAPYEQLGKDVPYWVIDAGHKNDYTAKAWGFDKYQSVVDSNPDITFIQIGHSDHNHPELKGNNLINLVGKTDIRQCIRLIYNAFGVITPCSMPMVMSYSIPPHPRFKRASRACIVIAGGREPNHWQQGPNQQFLHTCGMLDCCDLGGCWKSRVVALGDGDRKDKDLCHYPVKLESGQFIAKCMDMITVEEVNRHIRRYMDNLKYES